MTTLSALKAEIADDLARSDLTTQIATEITAAIRFYQAKPFWFTEGRETTFDTVASQSEYTSADISGIYRLDGVWLAYNGDQYDMDEISNDKWEGLQDTASIARPYSFARYNEAIRLFPIPDAVYSIRLTGHLKIAGPASDDEADNPWMVHAYELIRARAVKNLFGKKLQDLEMAQVWQGEERSQLNSLYGESNRRTAMGRIRGTQF